MPGVGVARSPTRDCQNWKSGPIGQSGHPVMEDGEDGADRLPSHNYRVP